VGREGPLKEKAIILDPDCETLLNPFDRKVSSQTGLDRPKTTQEK
jgi:hypothetical protein